MRIWPKAASVIAGTVIAGTATLFSSPLFADVILTGPTSTAGTYSTAALQADGSSNPGDVINSGGLTGISLWGLLGGGNASSPTAPVYGSITTSTPAGDNGKNAILRYYVVGTGSGGAQTAVSLGQIDPNFGGTSANAPAQPFVAYQTTGGGLLSAPELIVPGAPAGSAVSNLTTLQLLSVAALPALSLPPGTPAPQSSSVTLSGLVTNPASYTLAQLNSNPNQVSQTVGSTLYTGIPLYTFLNPSNPNINGQIVIGQATDGYEVVYSLDELLTSPTDLLAFASSNMTEFPASGVARTILPGDSCSWALAFEPGRLGGRGSCPRTRDVGDDDPGLPRHGFHGLSSKSDRAISGLITSSSG